MDFMDFGKEYDRVNKEALWQVLRMLDVGGKLLNGFKSMDVNSLACVIVNGGKNECSRIDWGVRDTGTSFLLGFTIYSIWMQ